MTEQAGTTFTLNDIKRRVAKLRKLAERAGTEGERDVALEKAAKLMEQHAITEWMVRESSPEHLVFPVTQFISFGKNQPYIKARRSMLAAIGEDNRVQVFMMAGRDRMCLVGFQSDIDYTLELYASLELHMVAMMKVAEVRNLGNTSSFRTNFAYGYVSRIYSRLSEWRRVRETEVQGEPGTALVLRDRSALVQTKVEEEFGKKKVRKGPAARHRGDYAAFAAGAAAAESADLSGGRKKLGG
jgi:Protein of unknown function (DUF2786)